MSQNYDELLEQAKEAGRRLASQWIPKLCQALRNEDRNLSNDDIRDRVEKDCLLIWSRSTITNALPEEYKNKEKAEAGRRGRQKQLQSGGLVTETEEDIEHGSEPTQTGAEFDPDSSNRQGLQTFPETEAVKKLQDKLGEVTSRVKVLEQTRQPAPDVQVLENQLTYANKMIEKLRLMALKPDVVLDDTTGIVHDSQVTRPDEMTLKRYNLDLDKTNDILTMHVKNRLDKNKELKKGDKLPLVIGSRILGKDKHTMIPANICIWFEEPRVTAVINEARLSEIKDHS